jgi:hypothetical protein
LIQIKFAKAGQTDSRAESYIRQYGNRCWETDALPGSAIEAAIEAEINTHLNMRLWNRRAAEIEKARKLL